MGLKKILKIIIFSYLDKMNLKVALVLAILSVVTITTNTSGLEDDKIEQALSLLKGKGIEFGKILHNIRINVDQKLIQLFPKLKSKIEKSHSNFHLCYDQTIDGHNETINIFKEKIRNVVMRYFVSVF